MSSRTKFFLRYAVIAMTMGMYSQCAFPEAAQSSKPMLLLHAKWSEKESPDVPLGLRLNQGWYEGFEHIAVRGKQLFVADNVFGRIALFEDGKYRRSYPNPTEWEYGFVVSGNDLFVLDKYGYLFRMNLDTRKVISSANPVVTEQVGVLTDGLYSMYSLGDQLVINRNGEGNDVCVGMQTLEVKTCVGMPRNYLKEDSSAVVLDGEQYITLKGRYALLHDGDGKVIARAYWPDSKPLYADPAWVFTKDGIYFTQHSERSVRIYFQAWELIGVGNTKTESKRPPINRPTQTMANQMGQAHN